jgi:DNA-binding response OmpR family regulator
MKFKLKSAGFDVDVAEDGEAALEKLQAQSFDVVLLDINMPRMSGLEALTIIRQQHPHTEAIMLTGFADFSTAIECLKNGARDYLVKPIDTTELVTRLRSLLRSRLSEKALLEVQQQYTSVFLNDMLNPLNKMQEVLDRASKLSAEHQAQERNKLIEEARETAGTMASKIKKLLDFSNTEFNQGKLESGQFNPEELAERIRTIRSNGV